LYNYTKFINNIFCILDIYKKKKIYLFLSGGLGNQLFQYAFARNLAIKNGSDLVVDSYSGFIFDFKYFRKCLLDVNFKRKIIIFFSFFRICKKFFLKNKTINNFFLRTVINEFHYFHKFNRNFLNLKIKKKLYLFGLFQSEKYFLENKKTIIRELMPSKSRFNNFLIMKEEIIKNNSIVIGFRLFEEASKDSIKIAGGVVNINFYIKSIKIMLTKIKNPKFYLFSQNIENLKNILKNIKLLDNYSCNYVTPQNGFRDEMSNLWLMSYCKNLIIPNSTFYWWGAYFSRNRFKKNNVICSYNFPNKSIYLNDWRILK